MTYIVTDNCILCKLTDCVEVCPVECFHEGENFIVINPDECIDCGVCVPECPQEAIYQDELLPEKFQHFADLNKDYAEKWPLIVDRKDPMQESEKWDGVEGKLQHLSSEPAVESIETV